MLDWLFVVVSGRVLVEVVRTFPPAKNNRVEFFKKLFTCPICLGFWTYFCLFAFFGVPKVFMYVPLVSEVLMACLTSFTVNVFVVGWTTLYGNFVEE